MASQLTLNNSALSRDGLLLKLATSCDNAGWSVTTHPSASYVTIQNAPITAFFPGLYIFWTVRIGAMPPTVFIPDQASFDAFTPPEGYEKYLVDSYEPLEAFNAALGMAKPLAGKWSPVLLGDLPPDPGAKFTKLVGWYNPGNVIDGSSGFFELENCPQSVFALDFQMGAALQCSWGIPVGGGYACQSVPLKVDISDPDTNYFSLFFTTGIQNVEALFAPLRYYASHSKSAGIHAFFEPPSDASNYGDLLTDRIFDLYVSPHALFYCKSPGSPNSYFGADVYGASVLPIGDKTSTAFVCKGQNGIGFRYSLTNHLCLWLLVDDVIYNEFTILINFLFTNGTNPHSAYWEADGGAVQNIEAFVLVVIGRSDQENYQMLGVLEDMFIGNGKYISEGYFDHDGSQYYTFTLGHRQASLMVKI